MILVYFISNVPCTLLLSQITNHFMEFIDFSKPTNEDLHDASHDVRHPYISFLNVFDVCHVGIIRKLQN